MSDSLALASFKIAEYTVNIDYLSGQISSAEAAYQNAIATKAGPGAIKETFSELQRLKTLMGMMKDFIEFWKDVIKSIMGILKSFNELAQGSR